jgi:hypothetical protein
MVTIQSRFEHFQRMAAAVILRGCGLAIFRPLD